MLGSSLTITLDGSGGTAVVLPLINQDNYTSEYFLNDNGVRYTAKVRHTLDKVPAGSAARERHSVEFKIQEAPDEQYPLGKEKSVIYTILNNPADGTPSEIIDLSEAMSFYMVKAGGIAAKLLNKES